MDTHDTEGAPALRRTVAGLAAAGALVTGVFGWIGSAATTIAHPPMEAAVFLVASGLAFGLAAVAAFRR